MAIYTLYFGEAIDGRGDVTAKEWLHFLDGTVTPNLPDGYTVLDGDGAWMDPRSRTTTREPSKVLIAALPETPHGLAAVNRVRDAYRVEFHQQSVGMTVQHGCGAF